MNKKIFIPAIAVAVGGGLLYGASNASAYFGWGNGEYPPIVEKLVERFNLDEAEVKTFFEEQRQEREQQMEIYREERLNQAVADGVITEEQKQALINKWEEKPAEREQHREETENWFKEQGIDPQVLHQYGGFRMGMHAGHGGFGMWHPK